MNKVILIGRLTGDPEVRYTTTGKAVAQFRLAVDRPYTGQDGKREADFINMVAWGKLAEVVGNNLSKGRRVGCAGRLQIRQYTDKDGAKRYATEVVADTVEFLDYKDKVPQAAPAASEPANFESFGEQQGFNFDEEIPF